MNKTVGPHSRLLFDYTTDAPVPVPTAEPASAPTPTNIIKSTVPVETLEGADDDAAFTKIVNRRWYERNKHIFPASAWENFEASKDYSKTVRRDAGGNVYFFS